MPTPPPLPLAAAWPVLEAPLLTPSVPGYFHLEAAVGELQDLETARAVLMERMGVFQAHRDAFQAAGADDPRSPQLNENLIRFMRSAGEARDEAYDKARAAYAALSRLTDYVREEDLGAIRAALDADDPTPAFGRMTSYLVPLRGALARREVEAEPRLRAKLDVLQQMISGLRPVAGLPAVRYFEERLLPSGVPDWALMIHIQVFSETVMTDAMLEQLGGAGSVFLDADRKVEIRFECGGYWIGDVGEPPSGAVVDGRPLKPGSWRRVSGAVTVAAAGPKGVTYKVILPDPPLLEALRLDIARAGSLNEVAELLRPRADSRRHPSSARFLERLERHLADGSPLGEVPVEGGLRARVQELILEERYRNLRDRYAAGLDEAVAQRRLEALARAADRAGSSEDLLAALASSRLPAVRDLASAAAEFFAAPTLGNLARLPRDFGLRAKAEFAALSGRVPPDDVKAMRQAGLEPVLLLERPWTGMKPSDRLQEEIEALKALSGRKLRADRIEEAVKNLVDGDFRELRAVAVFDAVSVVRVLAKRREPVTWRLFSQIVAFFLQRSEIV